MTNITMSRKHKKGISTVLTTLIIVVASVVLGTAVTLFGTSLFQTGAQAQGMSVSNAHIWQGLNGTDTTVEGAVVVRNTGDKLIAVDGIEVRGASVVFSNWFASTISETTPAVQQLQLAYCTPLATAVDLDNADGNNNCTNGGDITTALAKQSSPVSLEPGKAVIIYFIMPRSNDLTLNNEAVTSSDVGAAATMKITAGQITAVQSVSVAKNI